MITTYHRPRSLDEALTLLTQPNRIPLGGGTLLSKSKTDPVEVVDLQALSLDSITKSGNNLEIGATATLQQLLESVHCPDALKAALNLEAPLYIRNTATVAGTVVASDGRSTFAAVLLAMDAKLEIRRSAEQSQVLNTGEFLPLRPRGLSTSILLPLNQWWGRLDWWFPWKNMVLWGMGLALGLTVWGAWLAAGVELPRGRQGHLLPWLTVAVLFFYLGM